MSSLFSGFCNCCNSCWNGLTGCVSGTAKYLWSKCTAKNVLDISLAIFTTTIGILSAGSGVGIPLLSYVGTIILSMLMDVVQLQGKRDLWDKIIKTIPWYERPFLDVRGEQTDQDVRWRCGLLIVSLLFLLVYGICEVSFAAITPSGITLAEKLILSGLVILSNNTFHIGKKILNCCIEATGRSFDNLTNVIAGEVRSRVNIVTEPQANFRMERARGLLETDEIILKGILSKFSIDVSSTDPEKVAKIFLQHYQLPTENSSVCRLAGIIRSMQISRDAIIAEVEAAKKADEDEKGASVLQYMDSSSSSSTLSSSSSAEMGLSLSSGITDSRYTIFSSSMSSASNGDVVDSNSVSASSGTSLSMSISS